LQEFWNGNCKLEKGERNLRMPRTTGQQKRKGVRMTEQQEAELIRLRYNMEIIRTICPIMMLVGQIFLIVKLY